MEQQVHNCFSQLGVIGVKDTARPVVVGHEANINRQQTIKESTNVL